MRPAALFHFGAIMDNTAKKAGAPADDEPVSTTIGQINAAIGAAYCAILDWLESDKLRLVVQELKRETIERTIPSAANLLQMPPECLATWMIAYLENVKNDPEKVRDAFDRARAEMKDRLN